MPSFGSEDPLFPETDSARVVHKKENSMATIMPASELVRRAAAWLAEQRALYPEKSLAALLDDQEFPLELRRLEDSYQLCSAPEYGDQIRKAFEIRKPAKLSQPALEVLTIIAYYQPTTRAYVDQIRGVDSSYTVGLLLDRHLIEECGRLQVPGRPRLYRTTKKFLRDFHLSSLEELPEMPGIETDGQLRMGEDGTILDPSAMTEKEGSVPENGEH